MPGGRGEFERVREATRANLKLTDAGEGLPSRLAGRYEILGEIGRGAYGTVRRAHDHRLSRDVAIKFIPTDGVDEGEVSSLFREAEVLATLEHPNVVAVYDAGESRRDVYIVMACVDGTTLEQWLKAEERGWLEIVAAFEQAARALEAAHRRDLVHRDFKPGNAMIDRDQVVRVLDFGVARRHAVTLPEGDDGRTSTTGGTAGYMAPEQNDGHVDARSDQFAFCASLFQALYGVLPYDVPPAPLDPKSPRSRAASNARGRTVPKWLREVVMRGLELEPAARFPDMTALRVAMNRRGSHWRWGAAGVLALSVAGIAWSMKPDSCATDDGITQLWSPTRREFLQRAGESIDRPSIDATLAAFTARWAELYQRGCRARRSGAIDEELFAVQRGCLERSRHQTASLIEHATAPEFVGWRMFEVALNELTDLSMCEDDARLAAARQPEGADLERSVALEDAMGQATVHELLGDHRAYVEALMAAESQLADPVRAPAATLWLSLHLGRARLADGRPAEAEARLRPALLDAQRWHRWPQIEALLMAGLAEAVCELPGRADEAMLLAEQAVATMESSTIASDHLTGGLQVMALTQYRAGRPAEALQTLERARAGAPEPTYPGQTKLADRHSRSAALNLRGLLLEALGRNSEAEVSYREGLGLLAENGTPSMTESELLGNLGVLLRGTGRLRESMQLQRRAVAMRIEIGRPDKAVGTMINIGNVLFSERDYDAAVSTFDEALRLLETAPNPADEALARLNRAYALQAGNRVAEAISDYGAALAITASTKPIDADMVYAIEIGRGTAQLAAKHEKEARVDFEAALGHEAADAGAYDRAELRLGLAKSLVKDAPGRSKRLLDEAESIARDADEHELAVSIGQWRSSVQRR